MKKKNPKEKPGMAPLSAISVGADPKRLQNKLATRLLLIFLFPVIAFLLVGYYGYNISARVTLLEVGEKVNYIERLWTRTGNVNLVIHEYEKLRKEYQSPELLVRLGGLYFRRSNTPNLGQIGDIERALELLHDANARNLENHGEEFWLANSTLASLYEQQNDLEKAIEAGEKAVKANPNDAEALNTLAWIYADSKDPAFQKFTKAKRYAEKASNSPIERTMRLLIRLHWFTNGWERLIEVLKSLSRSLTTMSQCRRLPWRI